MTDLTAERLREVLAYDPKTGLFRWLTPLRGRAKAGEFGGTDRGGGYLTITVDSRPYRAHRLAWLHVKGRWPKRTIDHLNGDPSDNRIANLRDVSMRLNSHNRAARERSCVERRPTKTGERWRARIGHFGGSMNVGTFDTEAEATAAVAEARRLMHAGFIPGRSPAA